MLTDSDFCETSKCQKPSIFHFCQSFCILLFTVERHTNSADTHSQPSTVKLQAPAMLPTKSTAFTAVLVTASLGSVSHQDVVSETVPEIEEKTTLAPTPTVTTCAFVKVKIPQPPIVLEPVKFMEQVPFFSNTRIDEFLPVLPNGGTTTHTADYIFKKANSDPHLFVDVFDVEMEPRVVIPKPLVVFEALCVEVPVWDEVVPPEITLVAEADNGNDYAVPIDDKTSTIGTDLWTIMKNSLAVAVTVIFICFAVQMKKKQEEARLAHECHGNTTDDNDEHDHEDADNISQAIVPASPRAIVQHCNVNQMLPMGLATQGGGSNTKGANDDGADNGADDDRYDDLSTDDDGAMTRLG